MFPDIELVIIEFPQDFREKNTDHMRPDIVALLRSSERAFVRQLIGMDPVAMFRWGILRATIRGMAAFNLAGRRWATKNAGTVHLRVTAVLEKTLLTGVIKYYCRAGVVKRGCLKTTAT